MLLLWGEIFFVSLSLPVSLSFRLRCPALHRLVLTFLTFLGCIRPFFFYWIFLYCINNAIKGSLSLSHEERKGKKCVCVGGGENLEMEVTMRGGANRVHLSSEALWQLLLSSIFLLHKVLQ